ncbi:MAG TPA: hypothetical protein VFK38_00585 [Candidatus Limnocylindrales bacterium]|nr:hypothetical protein [Candidatus Limnocylindrales bacterium]
MPDVDVIILHRPAAPGDGPLTQLLAHARSLLAEHHDQLFRAAGATRVAVLEPELRATFGEWLADAAGRLRGGLVLLGAGAVARLSPGDAQRLLAAAGGTGRRALTNNRHSSDVCAVAAAAVLRDVPPLPSDNALPRWLEERAGFTVAELPGRRRLALDLDSPLDIALLALAPTAPAPLRRLARTEGLAVPRADELRALAADPRRELLLFGRSSAATLRWLERNVRCRVRFLAEERGLRASSPLAIGGRPAETTLPRARPPRASLGRLLDARGGPAALGAAVAELADGAIIDSRVLLADRLGADESAWPPPEDRFGSDLLRPDGVRDAWLAALTRSAAERADLPILLGGHTLVGPGVPLLLAPRPRRR